jgi:ABC-type sugar transport system substrate-binding protein
LAVAIAIGACGGDDDEEATGGGGGERRTVAVNMYTADNPYFQQMVDGIESKAKEFGWEVKATFGAADPTQQVNQIQNAVTTQPDALIVVPIDEEAIVPPIRQASEADIPVFTMGDNIAEEGRDAQVAYVGVDYADIGAQKAEFIVNELGDEGGRVGIIRGIRGLNFTEAGDTGSARVFEKAPGIETVDGPYTGAFSSDLGLEATQNLLTRAPNLDAIFFDNDSIAIGGIQALEERNIPLEDVVTVGTDGTPAAVEAVQKGTLDYTIHLCGKQQGEIAMDAIRAFLEEDKRPKPFIDTPIIELTPDNIKERNQVVERDC